MIHWELCKKYKFNQTNKWYMQHLLSVLENETHKLPWDFDIQTDHRTSARQPDLTIINKKRRTCRIVDFADHRVKLKASENEDKHEDLARELEKNCGIWRLYKFISSQTRSNYLSLFLLSIDFILLMPMSKIRLFFR